jgi:hypothetical protein
MAQKKEFRWLSTAPTGSPTGISTLYADTSGILKVVRPGGDVVTVGGVFQNILSGNFPGQLGTFVTGLQPSVTGSLGSTKTFFVVTGPSGGSYALPAYAIV